MKVPLGWKTPDPALPLDTSSLSNHIIGNVDGLQTALDTKAPLASPALTGTPTAPTAASGTNTTQLATTAFVQTAVSGLSSGMDLIAELTPASGVSVVTLTGMPAYESLMFIADTTTDVPATISARLSSDNFASTSSSSLDFGYQGPQTVSYQLGLLHVYQTNVVVNANPNAGNHAYRQAMATANGIMHWGYFIGDTGIINAVRFSLSAGVFTGGSIYVYGT